MLELQNQRAIQDEEPFFSAFIERWMVQVSPIRGVTSSGAKDITPTMMKRSSSRGKPNGLLIKNV
jgi:hypothetical protein